VNRDTWIRVAVTVLSAALLSVLSPPLNVHWLHWVAFLPMFWVLDADTPRRNWRLGWLYGIVGVGLLFRWMVFTIILFSPGMPTGGAQGVLVLFSLVFGLPYALLWGMVHPMRRRLGVWWVLAWPALQVSIEWLSMHVLLFPYNHGVSQYRVATTWQLASVTGVFGLTFLVFFVNATLGESLYRWREGRRFSPVLPAIGTGALSAVVLFGTWRYERVETTLRGAETLRVAQLQSKHGMDERMSTRSEDEFAEWMDMTRAIPPGAADLVVWPEGASPYDLDLASGRRSKAATSVVDAARAGGFDLAIGGGRRQRVADAATGKTRVEAFNTVYWFRADGTSAGHYDKMVPLAFGEKLPFPLKQLVPGMAAPLGIGDFREGYDPVVFDGTEVRAATPICYEAILPGTCRLFRDADLLVNVTNDAWFGNTANPHQHAMLAATRSVELGIPMFRSAYTGISMVIEPHGVIHDETRPFEQVARIVTVRLGKVDTVYARFGDWFVGLCAAGLAAAAVRVWRRTD
jgi:apolipoprotein N-acyltransferase